MWDMGCRTRDAGRGMQDAECGTRNVGRGMWDVGYGTRDVVDGSIFRFVKGKFDILDSIFTV